MWLNRLGAALATAFARLRGSVRLRLLAAVLLFSSVVTLSLTLVQLFFEYERGRGIIENRLAEIGKSSLGSLGEGLWRLDDAHLRIQLEGILHLPDIRAVEVRESAAGGTPLTIRVGQHADGPIVARDYTIMYRVADGVRSIGTLRVEATLVGLYQELINTALVILVTQGFKTFLVSLFIIYIVHRLVTRHLAALAEFVRRYDLHDPPPPLRLARKPRRAEDELESVVTAFNAMCANLYQAYCDLREREARIRCLVDSSIIGVIFADLDGDLRDANEAFLDMVGYTRQELRSGIVRWKDLTPPEHLPISQRAVDELRRTGTCTPFQKEYLRKDGTRVPVLVGGAMLSGSTDATVAFVLDMTEHRRAEAERQARQAAELASRAKSAFLANMSHELRTPLNAILGYAHLLKLEKALSERQRSGLDTIQHSGEHLLALINDVLDLSRIEAGRLELYPTAVDLPAFLRVVSDIVRVRAEERALSFSCEVAADLPQAVCVDVRRLRQILLNLTGNAVQYTDDGEVRLRVGRLPDTDDQARLRFEVRDTGRGIPPERLEAIFEPFEQVGDALQRVGGSGLGLTISRQLAHLMDSDIQVESLPGRGSRFWFELSLPTAAASAAAPEKRTIVGYRGARRRILVVDDVAENRAMLRDLLGALGFDVREAASGRETLEQMDSCAPDLVLMDLVMPEMDGAAAIRRIRQMTGGRRTPIIAVSASVSWAEGVAHPAADADADAFLPKPLAPGSLMDQIGAHLGLSWIYEQAPPVTATDAERTTALLAPPLEEIQILHELSLAGNMRDICERAAYLTALEERYRPFAERLRELAMSYQSKAIRQLIEQYLRSS